MLGLVSLATETETLAFVTDKVYFDIEIDALPVGRIVFGLFGNVVPQTVMNFTVLSQGGSGTT